MRRILFVFLDGVGLGPASDANPLASTALPAFADLAGGQPWTAALRTVETDRRLVRPIDATLGVDGLPQSGTGQASLFTGVNCAKLVGRHFGPFPHSDTHEVLATQSVFHQIHRLNLRPPTSNGSTSGSAFANAYPPRFFEFARGRGRWTVTTRACMEAGVEVRGLDALRAGRALTADLTGAAWRDQLDLDVEALSVADAGRRLAALSRAHRFTLYEYFLTDKLGHGRLDLSPASLLTQLDRFFHALMGSLDPDEETLVVTSDHGNLEQMDVKTHTRHPVPLLVYGWAAPFFRSVTDLTGVTPALVRALRASPRE